MVALGLPGLGPVAVAVAFAVAFAFALNLVVGCAAAAVLRSLLRSGVPSDVAGNRARPRGLKGAEGRGGAHAQTLQGNAAGKRCRPARYPEHDDETVEKSYGVPIG